MVGDNIVERESSSELGDVSVVGDLTLVGDTKSSTFGSGEDGGELELFFS